jgi:hypothetical protein
MADSDIANPNELPLGFTGVTRDMVTNDVLLRALGMATTTDGSPDESLAPDQPAPPATN